jgi:aspartate racemase
MMHKRIGLIGGLSPESTVLYYLTITRKYVERFGNYGYPEVIIYSVNLQNYHTWRSENRWDLIAQDLVLAAEKLKLAGADFCIIATNTMHKVYNEVQAGSTLPFIHILQPIVREIKNNSLRKVGLIGTKFTMSEDFYKETLLQNGIDCIVPSSEEQEIIHEIIEKELVQGIITADSREKYVNIIDKLVASGAEGVILGCTEIPLLISQHDCSVPVFDTGTLHAVEALDFACL